MTNKTSLMDDVHDLYGDHIKITEEIVIRMTLALIAIDDAIYQQDDDMIETITEVLRVPR